MKAPSRKQTSSFREMKKGHAIKLKGKMDSDETRVIGLPGYKEQVIDQVGVFQIYAKYLWKQMYGKKGAIQKKNFSCIEYVDGRQEEIGNQDGEIPQLINQGRKGICLDHNNDNGYLKQVESEYFVALAAKCRS